MYKKMIKTLVMVGLVALTSGSVPALAEEDSLSVSADVGVFSQYVWRGYALSDDSFVVQPSLTFAYGGFGLNFWGNWDSDFYGTGSDYWETDVTLSYDWSYDTVSMGLGYIYYDIDGGDTQEIYYTVGFDTILAPSITIYRDIDAFEGWYINIGIGHSIPVADDLALDLAASIGYYDLDDVDYSELHDGSISASMTFAVNDSFSITPSLAYTFGLSSTAKDELEDADGDSGHFVAGITGSYSF